MAPKSIARSAPGGAEASFCSRRVRGFRRSQGRLPVANRSAMGLDRPARDRLVTGRLGAGRLLPPFRAHGSGGVDPGHRGREIRQQVGPGAGAGDAGSTNQDVVPARAPGIRQNLSSGGAQPALGAVARHGVADLARAGDAEADDFGRRLGGTAALALKQKTGGAVSPGTCGADEIGAPGEPAEGGRRRRSLASSQAQSTLRPRARRAFSTLRPPLVAMRARKPCRRLRTRLLG